MSRAGSSVFSISARAADSAYDPPEPIARIPSSGSMMSPVPEMMKPCSRSVTASRASRRRSTRSLRQSLASSTAARGRLFGWLLELLLELLEQRKSVGRRARESGQQLAPAKSADFLGVGLHDRLADGDLAVTAKRDLPVAANREDCGRSHALEPAFHGYKLTGAR